jgi:predicted dinucleotide-binding enzyme
MKITLLGTGMVGRILAPRLIEIGHEVRMETRDPEETKSREQGDRLFEHWLKEHPQLKLCRFGESCDEADIIINATNGKNSISALEMVASEHLKNKTVLDLTNPLDFSNGMPPSLFVSNTDSLAEQIQRRFPEAHVVKSLNTLTASLMLDPDQISGDHVVFICGNDESSKQKVKQLLHSASWEDQNILDLGDITGSRGMEQSLPLWIRIWSSIGTVNFNFNVVRKEQE